MYLLSKVLIHYNHFNYNHISQDCLNIWNKWFIIYEVHYILVRLEVALPLLFSPVGSHRLLHHQSSCDISCMFSLYYLSAVFMQLSGVLLYTVVHCSTEHVYCVLLYNTLKKWTIANWKKLFTTYFVDNSIQRRGHSFSLQAQPILNALRNPK